MTSNKNITLVLPSSYFLKNNCLDKYIYLAHIKKYSPCQVLFVSLHPISNGNHEALCLALAVGKREKLPIVIMQAGIMVRAFSVDCLQPLHY